MNSQPRQTPIQQTAVTGTPDPGQDVDPGGLRGILVRRLQRHLRFGTLALRWPDGRVSHLTGTQPGPDAMIHIHRLRAFRRLALGGSVGFAEAYMDGDWDSPDLARAIELGARHRLLADTAPKPNFMAGLRHRLRHGLNRNSRRGSRRNIAFHYDLGNNFYRLWLDPTMSYSSAIYERPDQPLTDAQNHKCRRLLSLLGSRPGESLLEIGCGWGNLAMIAAQEYGLQVTAITLSQEQHDYARARIADAGLGDQVSVELVDYRDIDRSFDHVASVEMFEAVGESYWQTFFDKVRDVLNPGGRAALQIITIDERLFESYRRGVDFIQRYIFPGGMLPSAAVLRERVRAARLTLTEDDGFGQHYAETLAAWRQKFLEVWPQVSALGFDKRFQRMWSLYLAYCEGGFRAGNIDVRQIALTRSN